MLEQIIERFDGEFVVIDGYDHCVMGVVETSGGLHLVYDFEKMGDTFGDGDWLEWYSFNVLPLSMLDNGPVFWCE